MAQVIGNLESQRRQYDLVELAKRHGFSNVEVIDDDLGRSASGSVARPGFERLVAAVCAGEVGAVLGKSELCCVLMHHDCRAMDAISIICLSYVVSSAHGLSTRTASTIHIGRTTGCCWV